MILVFMFNALFLMLIVMVQSPSCCENSIFSLFWKNGH